MDFSCTCPRREACLHFDKIFAVDSEEARRGTAVNESGGGGTVVTLLETRPRNSIALFLVYENETTSPRISRNSFQTIFLHARKLEAGSGLTVNIPRYAFFMKIRRIEANNAATLLSSIRYSNSPQRILSRSRIMKI